MQLNSKVVVITGASRGLGKCLADLFLAKGAKVVAASLNATGNSENPNLFILPADVSKEADMQKVAAKAIEKFGVIDIWINNAGVWFAAAPVEQMDMDKVHKMFDINVFGVINGSRAALNKMNKQNLGAIINIASTAGLGPRPLLSGYSASKYAVRGFSESLHDELVETKIKVVTVYPGGMKTALFNDGKPADYDQFMEPKDIAAKIIANLELENPESEIIFKRPAA